MEIKVSMSQSVTDGIPQEKRFSLSISKQDGRSYENRIFQFLSEEELREVLQKLVPAIENALAIPSLPVPDAPLP